MDAKETLAEATRIYETRHKRMASDNARQFCAGAVQALHLAQRIVAGDEGAMEELRKAELEHQGERG